MTIQVTTRQSEAHGGHCATCNQFFSVDTSPYWHWSKSVAMHRGGTGHKVTLYQIVSR
jgi:hypothetical protein